MAHTATSSEPLIEARAFLSADDLEFVLDGLRGLDVTGAFILLDGLRASFGWDQGVHLELVEHVTSTYDVRSLRS